MIPQTVLFGGTFDPVHNAHLEVARAAMQRFALSRVIFVPASNPPHKTPGKQAPWEDRVRMLELACAGQPGFEVSRAEANAGRQSYSIYTIEALLQQSAGPLCFLIGADAFAEIQTWYRWRDVVRLVEFIVVTRPGSAYHVPPGATVHELSGLRLPVSSSDIRRRLAENATGIEVPGEVLRYIRERGLYLPVTDPENKSITAFPYS